MRSPAGKRFGAKLPRVCAQISWDPKHPSFAFVHDRDFGCSPNQTIWTEVAWNVLGELRARRSLDVYEDLRLQRIDNCEPVAAQPKDMTWSGPISPRSDLDDTQSARWGRLRPHLFARSDERDRESDARKSVFHRANEFAHQLLRQPSPSQIASFDPIQPISAKSVSARPTPAKSKPTKPPIETPSPRTSIRAGSRG